MNNRYTKGFSIIELAMVLVIVGIIFAIGISIMIPLTDRMKRTATEDERDAAVAAVIGFVETNERLPTTGEFNDVAGNSKDTWGNDFIYIPDPDLTLERSICVRSSTDITVDLCGDASCVSPLDTADNTAFLILSSGANLNIQAGITADPVRVFSVGLSEIDDYAVDMDRPEKYDDIAKWVVLPELRLRLGCTGSPLRILDNPLPTAVVGRPYTTGVFAVGGVPFPDIDGDADTAEDYKWCVTSSLAAGLSYTCNPDGGQLAVSAECGWNAEIATETGTWQQCSSPGISGTPTSIGSFSLPLFARDDADNIDDNTFILTVSDGIATALEICSEYRVWNEKPASRTDYRVRLGFEPADPVTGPCNNVDRYGEVTADIKTLETNEVLEQHMTSNGSCGGLIARLPFNSAILADTNGDCCLDFENKNVVDKICPSGDDDDDNGNSNGNDNGGDDDDNGNSNGNDNGGDDDDNGNSNGNDNGDDDNS